MDVGRETEEGASLSGLLDRLPHRPPFLFLTRLRGLSPGKDGAGEWSITGDEWFLKGHFPAEPLVPGVLIVEAMAQLSGLVGLRAAMEGAASGSGGKGRLVHTDVRFDGGVVPPAVVELRSVMARSMQSLRQFDVSASVNGVRVARGSIVLAEVG